MAPRVAWWGKVGSGGEMWRSKASRSGRNLHGGYPVPGSGREVPWELPAPARREGEAQPSCAVPSRGDGPALRARAGVSARARAVSGDGVAGGGGPDADDDA